MNIEGLGDAVVEQLPEKRLREERCRSLPAHGARSARVEKQVTRKNKATGLDETKTEALLGPKAADALLKQIDDSKNAGLARVLMGLGIRFVGERTAELLAQEFGSIDALMAATAEELERVEEVGPRISQAILEFFSAAANRALVESLKDAGVDMTAEKKAALRAACGTDFCADRHAAHAHARRGQAEDRGGRRQDRGLGEQEDQLRGGRRRGRLEARQGARAEGSGD